MQCPRCLKLSGDPEDGSIHTCTPTPLVRSLEEKIDALGQDRKAYTAQYDRDQVEIKAMLVRVERLEFALIHEIGDLRRCPVCKHSFVPNDVTHDASVRAFKS